MKMLPSNGCSTIAFLDFCSVTVGLPVQFDLVETLHSPEHYLNIYIVIVVDYSENAAGNAI
jgi:hypothetical protein